VTIDKHPYGLARSLGYSSVYILGPFLSACLDHLTKV
jgi:hypothetical protein